MRIHHLENQSSYELFEENGSFKLHDFQTRKTYSNKECFEAIWQVIELIRQQSFQRLSETDLATALQRVPFSFNSIPKSLLSSIQKQRINRTYYDQALLKLLSSYRSGAASIEISNKTNFIIQHELTHLLRSTIGSRYLQPSVL